MPHGLLLPPDLVQPLLLRFSRDDLHVMATVAGHPDYEAVEAMIRMGGDDPPSIRAIITRHDQTQIDHVNDPVLLAQARGVDRKTCHRSIEFDLVEHGAMRRARLAFTSHAGEPIVLDVTTAAPPSAQRAGLTDPGRHSLETSLPIMWRGASTLAGASTGVTIGGIRYDAPVTISSPSFIAHHGYYTERHNMAVIRAGTIRTILRHRPSQIETGAEWLFESAAGMVGYRVAHRDDKGRVVIERSDGDEIIVARTIGDRLDISSIRLLDGDPLQPGFELIFDDTRFSLSVDQARDLVTGDFRAVDTEDGTRIVLAPTHPNWAVARSVAVQCSRQGGQTICVTSIGRGRLSSVVLP